MGQDGEYSWPGGGSFLWEVIRELVSGLGGEALGGSGPRQCTRLSSPSSRGLFGATPKPNP